MKKTTSGSISAFLEKAQELESGSISSTTPEIKTIIKKSKGSKKQKPSAPATAGNY